MRPIEEVHIAFPDYQLTLCGLSLPSVWRTQDSLVITLEDAVEAHLWHEDEKCEICWRDEEARTLMLLANSG